MLYGHLASRLSFPHIDSGNAADRQKNIKLPAVTTQLLSTSTKKSPCFSQMLNFSVQHLPDISFLCSFF